MWPAEQVYVNAALTEFIVGLDSDELFDPLLVRSSEHIKMLIPIRRLLSEKRHSLSWGFLAIQMQRLQFASLSFNLLDKVERQMYVR